MSVFQLGLLQLVAGGGLTLSGNTLFVNVEDSITIDPLTNALALVNDQLTPINAYYGADGTGAKGWFPYSAGGTGSATAAALTATGQTLYGYIVGLSGQSASTYATILNLAATGSALYSDLLGLSGSSATTINLAATGTTLYNDIVGLSGQVNAAIALTGHNLYSLLTGFSGTVSVGGGGVTAINGTSGALTLIGTGSPISNITVLTNGSTLLVSGSGIAQAIDLVNSGSTLYKNITGLSGITASSANLAATGSLLYGYVVGLSGQAGTNTVATGASLYQSLLTYSGYAASVYATQANLQLTGQQLLSLISAASAGVSSLNGLSGVLSITSSGFVTVGTGAGSVTLGVTGLATTANLQATGSTLYGDLIGLSGQAVATYATQANLQTTGSNLYVLLTGQSGSNSLVYATQVALTQSGIILLGDINAVAANLQTSGSNLYGLVLGLSGQAASAYATQAALANTGSTLYADIIGLSGLVSSSSAGVTMVNGKSGALVLAGAGVPISNIAISISGNTLFISGSGIAQVTDLINSGALLYADIIGLSGTFAGGGVPPGIVFTTGAQTITGTKTFQSIGFDNGFAIALGNSNGTVTNSPNGAGEQVVLYGYNNQGFISGGPVILGSSNTFNNGNFPSRLLRISVVGTVNTVIPQGNGTQHVIVGDGNTLTFSGLTVCTVVGQGHNVNSSGINGGLVWNIFGQGHTVNAAFGSASTIESFGSNNTHNITGIVSSNQLAMYGDSNIINGYGSTNCIAHYIFGKSNIIDFSFLSAYFNNFVAGIGNKILSGNNATLLGQNLIITGATGLVNVGINSTYLSIIDNSGLFSTVTGNWTSSGLATIAQLTQVSGAAGAGFATTANLALTGSNLYNDIISLSGQAATTYATQTALTNTGSLLYNEIVIISGNSNGFFNILTGMSGQANINYATVTNLALTGSNLYNLIVGLSGVSVSAATLAATGSALYNDIVGLSGQANGALSATGTTLYSLLTGISGVHNASFMATPIYTGSFVITGGVYRYEWTGAAGSTGLATLPAPSWGSGQEFAIKNESSGAYLILSGLVDYTVNPVINPLSSLVIASDNTRWVTFSSDPNPYPFSLQLTGAAAVFNWTQSLTYAWTLTANSTGYLTGIYDGGIMTVAVTNPSGYTLTWPSGNNVVKWPGRAQPTQTMSGFTDVWTFVDILGNVFGSVVQGF